MSTVQAFYDSHAEYEWHRLERHPMEFALTMRMLAEYLPAPPCRVLDIGGGPGRYSLALARQGYRVTLFDLSANCLAFAEQKAAEAGLTLDGFVHGNALDLGALADESYDAVILMGPMYHLLAEADRARSLREAHRVLKPGGVLGVAFISRYATLLTRPPQWIVANLPQIERELETGLRIDRERFTESFGFRPDEVAPTLSSHGFSYMAMIASEGIGIHTEPDASVLTGEDWEKWVDLNWRLASDPARHGSAVHLLAVAKK